MAQLYESRVATTSQLATLADRALEHDFNRQLTHAATASLDPDGYHILTLMISNHERMHLPCDDGKPMDPLHHRMRVLMKFRGTSQPREAWLDVTDTDWELLPVVQST